MCIFHKIASATAKLLLGFFVVFSSVICAETADGYIIKLNNDTVYGKVKISHFEQQSGNYILNGIEEESYHTRVTFAPNNSKKFKTYFTEMILGFGFDYNLTTYTYRRVEVKHKSIFKNENTVYKFAKIITE